MSLNYRTEEYYKKFIELQEKLRKSEEERLKLEMKFNEMVQITKEETQAHYKELRSQYKRFVEEDRRRQDRNDRILRSLDRIDGRLAMLKAKTERFKLLRQQYHYFLERIYKINKSKVVTSHMNKPNIEIDPYLKAPIIEENSPADKKTSCTSDLLVDHYIQNLSSQKIRDLLLKEEVSGSRLPFSLPSAQNSNNYPSRVNDSTDLRAYGDGEFQPNYANSIADDIMSSIYSRPRTKLDDGPMKMNVATSNFSDSNSEKLTTNIQPSSEDSQQQKKSPVEDSDMDSEWSEAESVKAVVLNTEKPLADIIHPSTDHKIPTEKIQHKSPTPPPLAIEKPKIIQSEENISPKALIKLTGLAEDVENKLIIDDNQYQDTKSPNVEISLDISQTKTHDEDSQLLFAESTKQIEDAESLSTKQSKDEIEEESINPESEKTDDYVQKDQQYEETVDLMQYFAGNDQLYEENGQVIQQYDEILQPIPHELQQQEYDETVELQYQYDEQRQLIQQYDDNGQPIQQLDENSQPIQQYDTRGYDQSYPQYDENGQVIQQYNDNGQSIQQYYQNQPQYDENGQPIQQYDENGQPIQQYDESGQPIQQYDESGQPIQPYYGQYEQQYDENGQLIQQYDYGDQQYDNGQYYPEALETTGEEVKETMYEPQDTAPILQKSSAEVGDVVADAITANDPSEETQLDSESIEKSEGRKTPNVMEMLDTDTESAKLDTKVSNDSDFDFSNG